MSGLLDRMKPKPKPDPLDGLRRSIEVLAEEIGCLRTEHRAGLREVLERISSNMAGVQELQDALNELDTSINNEIGQINAKLDELRGQVAPNLQPQVDAIKAAATRISGIIEDVVPEPTPEPTPPAPPERRR